MSTEPKQLTQQERAELAKKNFNAFLETKPSRQQMRAFMQSRGYAFMATNLTLSRKDRRAAGRMLGARMAGKALRGELNATV
jgi:hypothetical protein